MLPELQQVSSRAFGGLTAVRSVDRGVSEGEILGLIGPNGAGKTTPSNLVTGTFRPTRGTIIMVEHLVKALFGVSDRVAMLSAGDKLIDGTPEAVAQDPRVIDAYLGTDHTEAMASIALA